MDTLNATIAELVGARLLQIRQRLGLTQEDFAARYGLHHQTYRKYESGKTPASVTLIYALVEDGYSAQWIIAGEGAMQPLGLVDAMQRVAVNLAHAELEAGYALTPERRGHAMRMLIDHESRTGQPGDPAALVAFAKAS